jgi:hypothetical protein
MSHTKEPWHWYGDKGLEGRSETVLVGDCGLASCGRARLYVSEADMRLIAAAPDLLEACKRAVQDMTEWDGPTLEILQAAIAKAEGR